MRAIARTVALAALAGAGVVAGLLAVSHGATGSIAPSAVPLVARTSLDPSAPAFGDHIRATIAIEIDRRGARAHTLHVRYKLAPLRRIGSPHTIRVTRGSVELETISVPVACISDACLAAGGVANIRLAPVEASIVTTGGVRTVSAAWPGLTVRDRLRSADVKTVPPPPEADASPLPATYDISPTPLASVLDVVAAVLGVLAIALAAWELELLARRRRPPEGALARAIRLARLAQSLPSPERRRALERLVRALGGGELQGEATRLAWSEPPPDPGELEGLVAAIEREEIG
ncbi:MAG: hypothetical protein ACRDLP_18220 [Solirubrobacteraceae bacterium]